MKTTSLIFTASTGISLVGLLHGVDGACWKKCLVEKPLEFVCRGENSCSTCGPELSCSSLCENCIYSQYGGTECSCQPPSWEGDCFDNQIKPGHETMSRLNWFDYDDPPYLVPRRGYLFEREPFQPLSATDNTMIAGVLYTSTKSTLKMTAAFPPLHPNESRIAELLVYAVGGVDAIYTITSTIKDHTWHCLFRIDGFNVGVPYSYEIRYRPDENVGPVYKLDGVIPAQVDYPKVAALGCFGRDNISNKDALVRAVLNKRPDLVVLQGDQTYFHEHQLYGLFELLYSIRKLTKDLPTIVQMDDHDYGLGNLWGAERAGENSGAGFLKAPCLANYHQDLALGHLPDPPNGAPPQLDSGITVHYTNYEYGNVDFAILEARKFKSYNRDGTILGSHQEAWLQTFCDDRTKTKVVLSQTPFADLNTHFFGDEGELRTVDSPGSKDSNGFPAPGRETVMNILKNCGPRSAVVLSGDTHMSTAVTYDDYGVSECVSPSAINDVYWRLSFNPLNEEIEDAFGNKFKMLAVWNVDQIVLQFDSPGKSRSAADALKAKRADGFLTFEAGANTARCEAHGYRETNEISWQVDLPPGDFNPPIEGACWKKCLAGENYRWLCNTQSGCKGCDNRDAVCDRLCSVCSQGQPFAGLTSCNCGPPHPGNCWNACNVDIGGDWICSEELRDKGCFGCSDTLPVCSNLCRRCGRSGSFERLAGLVCDCS